MPSHNYGRFVLEAVSSVLQQTHGAFELIIVDDGSTDDTQERVATITDPRVRSITQPQSGVASARNAALEVATGEAIAFLDADDRWLPTMLERQVGFLSSEPDVIASFTNFRRFDHEGPSAYKDQFTYYPELALLPTRPARCGYGRVILSNAFEALIGMTDPPAWPAALMLRRSVVESVRFDPQFRILQDMHFFLRAVRGGTVGFNPEVLAEVRRHGANATADLARIPTAKLRVFEALGTEPLNRRQRELLAERVVRSRFVIARTHAMRRDWGACLTATLEAVRRPGRWHRKMRGVLSTAYWLCRELVLPSRVPGG